VLHRRKGLVDDWEAIVVERFGAWPTFSRDEQDQLAGIADWLLKHKHWESAHGFDLDDTITTTVAIEAAVLVLGLDIGFYREVSAIVLFPTTIVRTGTYAGPVRGTVTDSATPVLGEAFDRRGAVLVAWDRARDDARNTGSGHNVVFHEFAHKLDMLDNVVDGTPPLPDKAALARWVSVFTSAFTDLRAGTPRHPLDFYGGESPAECFAVATEAFFDVPVELEANEPELFAVLRDFYGQDPAARAGAAGG
jgi:Mlc titration factor MtfA (ptsG expression regulator)